MTIRTQESKIFLPVVIVDTVNVVYMESNLLAAPLVECTFSALVLKASPNHSRPQLLTTRGSRILAEHLRVWHPVGPNFSFAPALSVNVTIVNTMLTNTLSNETMHAARRFTATLANYLTD